MNLKNIPNFPHYCATKSGKIWSKYYRRFIIPYDSGRKGMLVVLCEQGKKFRKAVHRLVLETFIGPCPEKMVCCHNNGDFTDNKLKNLRWDTPSNNELDKHQHGTMTQAKLSISEVRRIRDLFHIQGLKRKEIAKQFNHVSIHTLNAVLYNQSWKWV